jgi:hypothetical protein
LVDYASSTVKSPILNKRWPENMFISADNPHIISWFCRVGLDLTQILRYTIILVGYVCFFCIIMFNLSDLWRGVVDNPTIPKCCFAIILHIITMLCVLHVLGGGWCWKKKNFRWINLEWFSGLNMHYNFMRHCSCRLLVCLVYRLYSSAKHTLYFCKLLACTNVGTIVCC